ncbi:hypothetical protein ABIC63_001173 [Pseudacidovorax sp. 1753]|uniref:hypothetical protein n=1 Tax=Pseudacidovorax sp. 1753 TaxID=3156419 RepID=UPI003395C0F6
MTNAEAVPPVNLGEALKRARSLLTEDDVATLKSKSLPAAIWSLHLTLGHSLRRDLGLWSDDAITLFRDITEKMPEHPALDADSASSALIAALWNESQ